MTHFFAQCHYFCHGITKLSGETATNKYEGEGGHALKLSELLPSNYGQPGENDNSQLNLLQTDGSHRGALCIEFDGIHVLLFSVVTPEEKLSTLPGEVKFDRDRDTLFIRCQVEIID